MWDGNGSLNVASVITVNGSDYAGAKWTFHILIDAFDVQQHPGHQPR